MDLMYPSSTRYPSTLLYPDGDRTTDGQEIRTVYGTFYSEVPPPSPPHYGYYFLSLKDRPGWFWQPANLRTGQLGALIGPYKTRQLATEDAQKHKVRYHDYEAN